MFVEDIDPSILADVLQESCCNFQLSDKIVDLLDILLERATCFKKEPSNFCDREISEREYVSLSVLV
jgi:hypothetical protein